LVTAVAVAWVKAAVGMASVTAAVAKGWVKAAAGTASVTAAVAKGWVIAVAVTAVAVKVAAGTASMTAAVATGWVIAVAVTAVAVTVAVTVMTTAVAVTVLETGATWVVAVKAAATGSNLRHRSPFRWPRNCTDSNSAEVKTRSIGHLRTSFLPRDGRLRLSAAAARADAAWRCSSASAAFASAASTKRRTLEAQLLLSLHPPLVHAHEKVAHAWLLPTM